MPVENAVLFADWQDGKPSPAPSDPSAQKPCDAPPRFKAIDRRQLFFRAVDVEALIEPVHAARAIWNVVEKLDLGAFREWVGALEGFAGRAATDPRLLVSLWIYAYSQ